MWSEAARPGSHSVPQWLCLPGNIRQCSVAAFHRRGWADGNGHLVEKGRRTPRHTQAAPQPKLAQDVTGAVAEAPSAAAAGDAHVTASRATRPQGSYGGQWAAVATAPCREVVAVPSCRAVFRPPDSWGQPSARALLGPFEGHCLQFLCVSPEGLGLCPPRWRPTGTAGAPRTHTPFLLDSQVNRLCPSPSFRLCFQRTRAGNSATLCRKSSWAEPKAAPSP